MEKDNAGSLKNFFDSLDSSTLVIFDVDEVLVYPKNLVQLQPASHFWERVMADFEERLGKTTRDLLHSIMLLQSQWKLTDPVIPRIVNNLQKRKIKVIALTAFKGDRLGRIKSVAAWRRNQLKEYSIDFSNNDDFPREYLELEKTGAAKKFIYDAGIVYTDNQSKGRALEIFLNTVKFKPKNIFFIDDRKDNLLDVKSFCENNHINFWGVHYTKIKEKYHVFDLELGKFQFHYLERKHIWLSDSKAKILQSKDVY